MSSLKVFAIPSASYVKSFSQIVVMSYWYVFCDLKLCETLNETT